MGTIDKPEKKKKLNAVIYTDGSAIPNPGQAGAGIHGYIFDWNQKESKTEFRPARYLTLNTGYKDNESAVNYLETADAYREMVKKIINEKKLNKKQQFTTQFQSFNVNPLFYIEGFTTMKMATNNVAELSGIIEVLEYLNANHEDVKYINIFTDSNYAIVIVRGIIGGLLGGYNYSPNANKEVVEELTRAVNKVISNGVKIDMRWVKGHSNNLGNIKADLLADIGREYTTTGFAVNIKTYMPKDYYSGVKINSIVLDNIDKIVDAAVLDRLDNNKSITYGIKQKDLNSNGKFVIPSSYVITGINPKENKELDNIISDLNKIPTINNNNYDKNYSWKKQHGNSWKNNYKAEQSSEEKATIINLKDITSTDVSPYIDKYGIDKVCSYKHNRYKFFGESDITLARISDDKLRFKIIYDLYTMYNDMFGEKNILDSAKIIDITEFILSRLDKNDKDKKSVHKHQEEIKYENKDILILIKFGVYLPDKNIIKKLKGKLEKIELYLFKDKFYIMLTLKDKDFILYNNPVSTYMTKK